MDIMQPRKIDGEGTYFNSCHLTSETLNNRQAIFDVNNPTLAWAPTATKAMQECAILTTSVNDVIFA